MVDVVRVKKTSKQTMWVTAEETPFVRDSDCQVVSAACPCEALLDGILSQSLSNLPDHLARFPVMWF